MQYYVIEWEAASMSGLTICRSYKGAARRGTAPWLRCTATAAQQQNAIRFIGAL